jgi:hypothetical protein
MGFEMFILLSATVAGYFDFRWHRVPNWLIGVTVALSLAWHAWQSGVAGFLPANGLPMQFTRVRVSVPYRVISLAAFRALSVNLTGEALMRNETSP